MRIPQKQSFYITPVHRALLFWGACLFLFLPLHLPHYPCKGAADTRAELESAWEKAKKLQEAGMREEAIKFCRQIDTLARCCPTRFAGFLVAANAMASTLTEPYEDRLSYILAGEQALQQYEGFITDDFFLRANILMRYERCRYDESMGELKDGRDCYEEVWQRLPPSHPDSILIAFRNALPYSISYLYERTGDYKTALDWLAVVEQHLDSTHNTYPGVFYNLRGKIKQSLQNYDQAELDYLLSEKAFATYGDNRSVNHFIDNYVSLADLHLTRSAPDKALAFLKKASALQIDRSYSQLYLHYQFAKTYLAIDSLEQALWHGREALHVVRVIIPGTYYWTGRVLGIIGEILSRQHRWEPALDSIDRALTHVGGSLDNGVFNPRASDTKLDLLKILVLKAKTLETRFQHSSPASMEWLEQSLQNYLQAIELIKILRSEYFDDEVKEYLSQRSFPVFEQALSTAFRLYQHSGASVHLETAFTIMETGKALSLLENLKKLEAQNFTDLPDDLVQRETRLKYKIATLEQRISEGTAGVNQEEVQKELRKSKREYQNLIQDFRHNYPAYYNWHYDTDPISLSRLQDRLLAEETLVEYFLGEKDVYVMAVDRTGVRLHTFPVTEGFTSTLHEFLDLVSRSNSLGLIPQITHYQQTGYRLYQQLIEPLTIATKKLIIVPDGRLHYLPFAALPTAIAEVQSTRAIPYLIRKKIISRNFSATVLFQQEAISFEKNAGLKPLLIVSPGSFPNDSRLSLDPESLKAEFGDQVRIERDLGKEELRRLLAEGYDNIFLFTHAEATGDDPRLQLYQDTLFLQELYATPVASRLVLLGACETGLGNNRRGEGVLSLARGFAYQNVPNTVMTLWRVNDAAALQISLDFLRLHLLEERSPAEALHDARLHYIDSLQGDGRPYMWAGFVGVGR